MAAVERGDMDAAQRMVDEASKRAGGILVYFITAQKGGGFAVFRD